MTLFIPSLFINAYLLMPPNSELGNEKDHEQTKIMKHIVMPLRNREWSKIKIKQKLYNELYQTRAAFCPLR